MANRHRWIAVSSTFALAVSVVAARNAKEGPSHHVAAPRPVPAPAFRSFKTATRAEVVAYARSLTFNTDYHAVDVRRLTFRVAGKVIDGPLATLAPEIGNTASSMADLEAGRIIARVTTEGAFPSQGFAKGDNYVWVDKGANGELRAVIVPADPMAPTKEFGFRNLHKYVNPSGAPAEARFRWNDIRMMETIWVSCPEGCCEVEMKR